MPEEPPSPSSFPTRLVDREDAELVDLAKAGRMEAFDVLIDRYKVKIYGAIYNMTGNHEDTNDLLLEVFEKAYFSINKFKGKSSFSTWIYQITKNHVINHCQKHKHLKDNNFSLNDMDVDGEGNEFHRELFSSDSTDKDVKLKELQKKLNEALQKLSNEHRLTVVLHDIEGKTSVEIGEIMGCSEGTVRSRLHYARQMLQTYLKEYLK